MKAKKTKKKRSSVARARPAPPPAKRRFPWLFVLGVAAAIAIAVAVLLIGRKEAKIEFPAFDANNAFAVLQKQCDFGPRVPGTAAHEQCRVFLVEELKKHAANVVEQTFEHTIPRMERTVRLTNIIAGFNLEAGRRILLAAHWDSRPWADQDADSSNHHQPVLGANDGASGVAVLLEIARVLKAHPSALGVDIVLFDGEDLGAPGDSRSYAIGSQHFARTKDARYHPQFALVLDMVGDRDLQIYQEAHSLRYASGIVDRIWGLASRLEIAEFIALPRYEVFDDHVPLIEAGIPAIDLIDFIYPHWHTIHDTPDKCSAASLEKVGKVVLAALYDPDFSAK